MSQGKAIVLATHGTLGDLHPFLAIALELQKRGHTPVIASSEYHRPAINGAGVEFRPLRPDISFEDRELHRRLTEPRRGLERVIREYMFPVLRETYEDLLAVVQDERADLLISQILIFAAPIVAEKTGVRWISTELQPGAFMSAYDPPVLAPVPSLAKLRRLGPAFHIPFFRIAKLPSHFWSKPVYELRCELGLPQGKDPLFEGRYSPGLVLALFSPIFGPPQPDWPANTIATGFPFYDESETDLAHELEEFLAKGEPPVIFTLGSAAVWDARTFFVESIAATQMLETRAVLLVGHDPLNQPHEPLPSNIFVTPYAPYAQIFPRASVVVHHGGIGTTAKALRAGKPMLVMPFGGDQYDNAARIERLGVGRVTMRNRYRAERVAAELKQLLEIPDFRERAEHLRRRLQAEDGVRTACNAIEEQFK